ncbi:phage tail tube protein [Psychrobacter sp. APC 3426]|uniref:phage tail tube protein n=1 Tax=Psychrobacter sp. APC 3426 TaxID=3035177 RepID=UPI0025B61FA0|nr:phage tail tube protein [Psychrobacter sp. APC 3426]MDN3397695.1 phage tail tube protein [Psychrobacter sp. APC 3426]
MAKVKKGVLTQGTQVWIKHGDTPELTKMVCITGIQLGDDSPTDIPDTCLEETDSATSVYGLNQPGEGSITINTDPENASHLVLLQLAADNAGVEVFVGWSDGTTEPTLVTDAVTLGENRTWTSFTALLKDSSPTFEPDSLVQHTISMKRQSKAITAYKTSA